MSLRIAAILALLPPIALLAVIGLHVAVPLALEALFRGGT